MNMSVPPCVFFDPIFTPDARRKVERFFGLAPGVTDTQLRRPVDAARLATLGDAWLNLLVLESLLPTEDPTQVKALFAGNNVLSRFLMALCDDPEEWAAARNDWDFKHRLGDLFEQCIYLCANPNASGAWCAHPGLEGIVRTRKCVLALKRWVLSQGNERPIEAPLDYTLEQLCANVAVFVNPTEVHGLRQVGHLMSGPVAIRSRGVKDVQALVSKLCAGDDARAAQRRWERINAALDDAAKTAARANGAGEENGADGGGGDDDDGGAGAAAGGPHNMSEQAICDLIRAAAAAADNEAVGATAETTTTTPDVPAAPPAVVAPAPRPFVPGSAVGAGGEGVVGTAEDLTSTEAFLRTRSNVNAAAVALSTTTNATSAAGDGFLVPTAMLRGHVVECDDNNSSNNSIGDGAATTTTGAAAAAGSMAPSPAPGTEAGGLTGASRALVGGIGGGIVLPFQSKRSVSLVSSGAAGKISGTNHLLRSVVNPSESPAALDPQQHGGAGGGGFGAQHHTRPAITVRWITRNGNPKSTVPFFPCCGLNHDSRRECPHRLQTIDRKYHPGTIEQGRQTRTSATKTSMFAHWSCCQRPLVQTAPIPTQEYAITPECVNGCVDLSAGAAAAGMAAAAGGLSATNADAGGKKAATLPTAQERFSQSAQEPQPLAPPSTTTTAAVTTPGSSASAGPMLPRGYDQRRQQYAPHHHQHQHHHHQQRYFNGAPHHHHHHHHHHHQSYNGGYQAQQRMQMPPYQHHHHHQHQQQYGAGRFAAPSAAAAAAGAYHDPQRRQRPEDFYGQQQQPPPPQYGAPQHYQQQPQAPPPQQVQQAQQQQPAAYGQRYQSPVHPQAYQQQFAPQYQQQLYQQYLQQVAYPQQPQQQQQGQAQQQPPPQQQQQAQQQLAQQPTLPQLRLQQEYYSGAWDDQQ